MADEQLNLFHQPTQPRLSQKRLPGVAWGKIPKAQPRTLLRTAEQIRQSKRQPAAQPQVRQPRLPGRSWAREGLQETPRLPGVDWSKEALQESRRRVYGPAAKLNTQPPDPNNRLVNKQVQEGQFNKANVKNAARNLVDAYTMGRYFRHVGVSGAIRHVLGMPQVPSHVNDHINSRRNQVQHGHQSKPIYAVQKMEQRLGQDFHETMDEGHERWEGGYPD